MYKRFPRQLTLPLIAFFIVVAQTQAQELKSITYFVAAQKAQIRSGPSHDDYPTSIAARGTPVKSFHETNDGWLAIQPPTGSFSWVPASQAYLLPGGKSIEITAEKAISWIGTSLGKAKQYRWQVELSPGEQLAVLGESTRKSSAGQEELWYRVAPPNGEFRWIHKEDVSSEPVSAQEPSKITSVAKPIPAKPKLASPQSSQDKEAVAAVYEETNSDKREPVQPAAFQDDVFGPSSQELRPIPSAPPTRRMNQANAANPNPWNGWHAWELTDDGFRFTLFDKLRGGSRARPQDPLRSDPFDISMVSTPSSQPSPTTTARRSRGFVASTNPPMNSLANAKPARSGRSVPQANTSIVAQDRPWRDPRLLGRNGSNSRSPSRSFASSNDFTRESDSIPASESNSKPRAEQLIAQIRDGVGALGSTLRAGLDRQAPENRPIDTPPRRDEEIPSFEAVDWYGVSGAKDSVTSTPPAQRQNPPADATPAYTESALNQLQADLTSMVAGPPASWNLTDLKQRTEYIIRHGASPVARGRARLLLDRIEEFENHADKTAFKTFGKVTSSSYATPIGSGTRNTSLASTQLGSQLNGVASRSGRNYDATGWLVPVYGAQSTLPEYALTNKQGQTIAYVTTLPGMNLSVYVNKPVGIVGLRGFLPQLQAGYIQAERVFVIPTTK